MDGGGVVGDESLEVVVHLEVVRHVAVLLHVCLIKLHQRKQFKKESATLNVVAEKCVLGSEAVTGGRGGSQIQSDTSELWVCGSFPLGQWGGGGD